jgi:hypothetical protein
MARKPADMVQLNLRFSETLRRRIEREAARHGWSMNAEIVARLEQSFSVPELARAITADLDKKIEQAIFEYAAKNPRGLKS